MHVLSPIGPIQGGIVGPALRVCFVPLGAVAGAGSGFSGADTGFLLRKVFPGLEQFPGDLQGFKTLALGSSSS